MFRSILISSLLALFIFGSAVEAQTVAPAPNIVTVYPKQNQAIPAVDSTFIFGHVKRHNAHDNSRLTINGVEVPVHEGGGFLAFLKVEPGDFVFASEYTVNDQVVDRDSLRVSVAPTVPDPPSDIFAIWQEWRPLRSDIMVRPGDRIAVDLVVTPGSKVWCEIPGLIDSVPMVESPLEPTTIWGESVFGGGKVMKSRPSLGYFTGTIEIPQTDSVIDTNIIYHALPTPDRKMRRSIMATPFGYDNPNLLRFLFTDVDDTLASQYKVRVNVTDLPSVVEFSDSVQVIRHGPQQGYFSIDQPEGIRARVVGAYNGWYKLKLSGTQFAWAKTESVTPMPEGTQVPQSLVRSLRTFYTADSTVLQIPLSGKHVFQVREEGTRRVNLRLFGVTSDTDWIRYDDTDDLVSLIQWSQPEPELYQIDIDLTQDLWGYDAYYIGNSLMLVLHRAPENVHSLRGKTIVVDPGHSQDPGAIGPTGLTEAEINLTLALELRRVLERHGATVVMTRDDDSHVPLYDRPKIAVKAPADLFVSIHNNALPDGVNPFENNGTSTYYYHPHSQSFAHSVHEELVRATRLTDHGFYHGNLAVTRPTQYPAILVECAFMMIPEQEAELKTRRLQKRIAKGIVRGIEEFLESYEQDQ